MEVAMSQAAGRGRNSRVLVVEDNEAQLRTLTAILEEEGFDTIGCSTATEALQHAGQADIAVAIVDLRLPALSGTELLKRFQELGDNVPVVVHTAYASYESAKDAINHGAFAYVEKACDPDEIVYHVRRAFQQHLEQYADELENAVADRTRELQEACEELGCEIEPVEYHENPVLTQQGEQRLIAWRNTVLRSDEGRIVGTLSSGADITERRLAEDQRRQLEAELAHIGRVHTVGEMAAALAHEINQPLYAIANYVRGTKRRVKRGNVDLDQVTEVMSSVSDEVDRAAGIISHLREFVRKGRPRRSTVDVKELVEDVMKLLEPDIRQNQITVHFKLDVQTPAVSADPVQIQQVAVNLIRNAIDAMSELPASERILSLAAKCTKEEAIEIAVADTGKGLSPDIADNVFEAFFTTKDDGLGIGLAISRTIVEAHGGRLWTVPNRPQGAVFCFTIPLQNGKADDELAAYRVSRG